MKLENSSTGAVNQITNQSDNNNNNNNNNNNISNQNKLLSNLIQIQQQQQLEFILKELINQQQVQLRLPNLPILPISNQSIDFINSFILNNNNNNDTNVRQSSIEDSAFPLARIEIDYNLSDRIKSTANSAVFLVNKKKITIGRKLNNLNQISKDSNNNRLADILIENSTLVSRQHFSIELKTSKHKFNPTNSPNNDFIYDDDDDNDHDDDDNNQEMFYYWKLNSTSKNGLFINTRYIQTGKNIRLLNKKYTFRFPNTNIRIYFESMFEDCFNSNNNPVTAAPVLLTKIPSKPQPIQSNKIAQILLQKQLEQQQQETNSSALNVVNVSIDDESSNQSNLSIKSHSPNQKCSDSSSDNSKKPPYSYAQLIAQAICSSQEQQLTLSQIYSYISSKYSYYKLDDKGWQNSIRHNLSLNRNFVKVARQQNEPGKGSFWRIEPTSELKVVEQAFSSKSRSSTPNGFNRNTQGTLGSGGNSVSPTSSSSSSSSLSHSPEPSLKNSNENDLEEEEHTIQEEPIQVQAPELTQKQQEKEQKSEQIQQQALGLQAIEQPQQIDVQNQVNNNQQLLVNLLQQNQLQIGQLSSQQISIQQLGQLQAILNNNINILNANPGLVQLLYHNLSTLSHNNDSSTLLLVPQQQHQPQNNLQKSNDNSVKLRLLLNDDSNMTTSTSLKRSLSQVLNEKSSYINNQSSPELDMSAKKLCHDDINSRNALNLIVLEAKQLETGNK